MLKREQHPLWMLLPAVLFKIALHYETSMDLVTFCFGSAFGMVTVLQIVATGSGYGVKLMIGQRLAELSA